MTTPRNTAIARVLAHLETIAHDHDLDNEIRDASMKIGRRVLDAMYDAHEADDNEPLYMHCTFQGGALAYVLWAHDQLKRTVPPTLCRAYSKGTLRVTYRVYNKLISRLLNGIKAPKRLLPIVETPLDVTTLIESVDAFAKRQQLDIDGEGKRVAWGAQRIVNTMHEMDSIPQQDVALVTAAIYYWCCMALRTSNKANYTLYALRRAFPRVLEPRAIERMARCIDHTCRSAFPRLGHGEDGLDMLKCLPMLSSSDYVYDASAKASHACQAK